MLAIFDITDIRTLPESIMNILFDDKKGTKYTMPSWR